MMVMHDCPLSTSDDDTIRGWARAQRLDRYPQAKLYLSDQVAPWLPDIAIVHFDKEGAPVERLVSDRTLSDYPSGG